MGVNMSDLAAALKGIGPDWFSAVGTVGALLVALILFGFQAWDRRRDARDRRRAHAELVSAVMGPLDRTGVDGDHQKGRTGIDLYNSSASPVYDVVVGIVFIQGAGPTTMEEFLDRSRDEAVPITTSKVLAPGRFRVWVDGVGWTSALSGRPGAEGCLCGPRGTALDTTRHGLVGRTEAASPRLFRQPGPLRSIRVPDARPSWLNHRAPRWRGAHHRREESRVARIRGARRAF